MAPEGRYGKSTESGWDQVEGGRLVEDVGT